MSRLRTLLLLVGFAFGACSDTPLDSSASVPPHEAYRDGLVAAGLGASTLVRTWSTTAATALRPDAALSLPEAASPRFEAAQPSAWSARIELQRGEVLQIMVVPALGADSARVFADAFWAAPADSLPVGSRLWSDVGWSFADSTGALQADTLRFERRVRRDEALVVRVQPELLAGGTAAVRISTAPSLAFPVDDADERAIRSRWGAPRDGGARSHEGVDIFAPRGTPVLAATRGRVSRVGNTPLGGLVVWQRTPLGALYYAHLDSQLVQRGQFVRPGDTLGLVGNTGNARSTPPHLHFGVYTGGGAVNPFPYLVGRRPGSRTESVTSP